MTRIGFAYNLKPDLPDATHATEEERDDEEPPSRAAIGFAANAAPSDDDEYAEWDSAETIAAVAEALARHGDVIHLQATEDFPEMLRRSAPDIVFNIAEGLRGANREAHVPAICEFFGIPCSGSDPLTLSLALDKARAKQILRACGVPTADWFVVSSALETPALAPTIASPWFAKPLHEGSSRGITQANLARSVNELHAVVEDLLERYQQPVLVESFLPGAEFTCGVLGNGVSAEVLPIVALDFGALPPGAAPVYGFEAKWIWDTPSQPLDIFECPARIPSALAQAIQDVVLAAYRALGCRDWSRVDVRLDAGGTPHVIEVNPLPGILPDPADNSCLPKAARAAGLSYGDLIGRCLDAACERTGVRLDAVLQ